MHPVNLFINHRANRFRRIPFQAIIDEDVSGPPFLPHSTDDGAQGVAGFRVLVLNLVVGLKLLARPGNLWVNRGVLSLGLSEEAVELPAGGVE